MRVLALDTTARTGSVAVLEDDRVVVERAGDASRSHAERLPGDLLGVLSEAGWTPHDVDLFAVAAGPGSFTGLRIGIAAMQGLAVVCRRPMVAVSLLDALGHLAACQAPPGTRIAAWIDAHRHDVYSALYLVGDGAPFTAGRLTTLDPPRVGPPASILEAWSREGRPPAIVIGDGAASYAGVVGGAATVRDPGPVAGAVGRIAVDRARAQQTVTPAGVQPVYVRRPDAEIARDRRGHA